VPRLASTPLVPESSRIVKSPPELALDPLPPLLVVLLLALVALPDADAPEDPDELDPPDELDEPHAASSEHTATDATIADPDLGIREILVKPLITSLLSLLCAPPS
jgi:hypothetical protein